MFPFSSKPMRVGNVTQKLKFGEVEVLQASYMGSSSSGQELWQPTPLWASCRRCKSRWKLLGTPAYFPRAPTAGGQYHWVSMLAPENYQKFISYITGRIPANHHSCKILADVQ